MTPILYIEDDHIYAKYIADLLSRSYSVSVSGRLKDGLLLLLNNTMKCILLDLGLPDSSGMDGIRALLPTSVPIVVLSGRESVTRQECVSAGACGFLRKGSGDEFAMELKYQIERAIRASNVCSQIQELRLSLAR